MLRKLFKRRMLAVLTVVFLLLFLPVSQAFAATSQNVTITSTPSYIAISNDIATWTLNGITGDDVVDIDTIYYSNPLGDTTTPSTTVVDGECRFELTDTSSVIIDLTVDIGDFTGGSDPMTNSDAGTNGAGVFGAHSWYSGLLYANKVVAKTTGSDDLFNGSAPGDGDIKWGAEVETQTDVWVGGTSSTSTMVITATKQ